MQGILFRTDAGREVGLGHLMRCLVLAQAAATHGIPARFLIYGDADAATLVKTAGFPVVLRPRLSLATQTAEVAGMVKTDEIAVLDFIHSQSLTELRDVPSMLAAWRKKARQVMLIDGSAGQALRNYLAKPEVDAVLAPYAGEAMPSDAPFRALFGPTYFVLADEYRHLPTRVTRADADRVLVTCGGADPYGITSMVMHGLEQITHRLQVRVAIGPLFRNELRAELAKQAAKSRHAVTLLDAANSLAESMLWCEVAVATSGLTKYELAAAGAPALLLSVDAAHEEVNRAFLAEGTALSLGVHDAITTIDVKRAVTDLLAATRTRARMAALGQQLVDGGGADRVVKEFFTVSRDA